jgi:hypothetical protein
LNPRDGQMHAALAAADADTGQGTLEAVVADPRPQLRSVCRPTYAPRLSDTSPCLARDRPAVHQVVRDGFVR